MRRFSRVAVAVAWFCGLSACASSNSEKFRAHYERALQYSEQGRRGEAIAEYREAVRLRPDSADAHNNLGSLLYDIGDTQAAVQEYDRALRLNPDLAPARNNLGVALLSSGKTAQAVAQFRQAVQLQPSLTDARFNLCLGLEILGQLEEAFRQCSSLEQEEPARPGLSEAVQRLKAKLATD